MCQHGALYASNHKSGKFNERIRLSWHGHAFLCKATFSFKICTLAHKIQTEAKERIFESPTQMKLVVVTLLACVNIVNLSDVRTCYCTLYTRISQNLSHAREWTAPSIHARIREGKSILVSCCLICFAL